jgi:UDP-3-O-[3-hydroxymyristoyl] glucosamine N-acyltransferase
MVKLSDIILYLDEQKITYVKSDEVCLSKVIVGPNNIVDAAENEMSFIAKKYSLRAYDLLRQTKASVIFCYDELRAGEPLENADLMVYSSNVKADFIQCLTDLFLHEQRENRSAHAVIHSTAKIGENFRIGHFSSIGEEVFIGDNVSIGANVTINKGTIIGNNSTIDDGAIIGGNGFGYVRDVNNENLEFPHFGKVIIEENVYIGNNTCIDRGVLSNTVIKRGVKIDNLVHIAHNVEIGEKSLIIACSMIAGSVVIGENAWIAPSATIRNGIRVGKNVTVGLASLITKDIPEGSTVLGVPALPIDDFKKYQAIKKEVLNRKKDEQ